MPRNRNPEYTQAIIPETITIRGNTYNVNQLLQQRTRSEVTNLLNKNKERKPPRMTRTTKYTSEQLLEFVNMSIPELKVKYPDWPETKIRNARYYAKKMLSYGAIQRNTNGN